MAGEYRIYIKKECDYSSDFRVLTGLNASRGVCIISEKSSAVFVDSRYTLAAHRILDTSRFELFEFSFANIRDWLSSHCDISDTIIYDWWFWNVDELKRIVVSDLNFIGKNLQNVYHATCNHITELEFDLTGSTYLQKLEYINNVFDHGDALLLSDPDSICWLLNIRGDSLTESLGVNGFALIHRDGNAVIYTNESINNTRFCNKHIDNLSNDLQYLNNVVTDKKYLPCALYETYKNFVFLDNPCIYAKATKNEVEISNMKQIHIEDGIALTKFIYWLYHIENTTEIDAADKLRDLRKLSKKYITDSFQYISAADDHAAEIHFHGTRDNNKKIKGLYLFDTGAQYYGGTTDVTRTVCKNAATEAQKEMYTRVLMGHIDLFYAKPNKDCLDKLARKYLHEVNADYAHGTGHGVGYMSSVHEDGVFIARDIAQQTPFKRGMILSNEPGYYEPKSYGIRLENMMYIDETHNGDLVFKNLTLAPYCNELICIDLLQQHHKTWLIDYYKELLFQICPHLEENEQIWLQNYSNDITKRLLPQCRLI